MSAVRVSRLVRLGLELRFVALFNGALLAACEEFGIPDLAYAINWAEAPDLPQNFFRGDRGLEDLSRHSEPEFPALAMWTGEGNDLAREMPRRFSGNVWAYWRFYLFVRGIRTAGLVDLREATEAAMIETLEPEFSGFGGRGDLGWQALGEQSILDQDEKHFGWVQPVTYSASFEVNV